MNWIKKILIICCVIYFPLSAKAWNLIGHRVVGQIADTYLNAQARKAIKEILGNESLAMSANWADFIKSDSQYDYLNPWHYINIPANFSKNEVYTFLEKHPGPSVYHKIPDMIAVLKDRKSTADQKKFALRLLVHLVGDIHQPMHTARPEDLGGNNVQLTWFGQKSNLHKVWDEGLVEYQKLSYTEYAKAINYPSVADFTTWQKTSLKDVVFESYQLCNAIYNGTKQDDKLSYRYNFDWISTVNQQLLKGGVRLAKILNDIYKQ